MVQNKFYRNKIHHPIYWNKKIRKYSKNRFAQWGQVKENYFFGINPTTPTYSKIGPKKKTTAFWRLRVVFSKHFQRRARKICRAELMAPVPPDPCGFQPLKTATHTHTHITYSYILRESLLAYEYMEKYTRRARAINTRFFTIAGAPGALIADAKSSGFLRQEAVRELLKPFPGLDLGSKVRGSPPCVAGVCSAHSLSAVFVVERFVPVERRLARA